MAPAKLQQLRTGHWAVEHFLAYFATTLIVCLGWRRPFVVAGAFMAIAALLEALQGLTPNRVPDLLSAVSGASGVLAAALLANLGLLALLGWRSKLQIWYDVLAVIVSCGHPFGWEPRSIHLGRGFLYDPPQLARFGVRCLPYLSQKFVILGLRALPQDELRPTRRLKVDRPEPRPGPGDCEVVALHFDLKIILGHFGRLSKFRIPLSKCRLLWDFAGLSPSVGNAFQAIGYIGLIETIETSQPI
jgi:hypothetical protein